MRHGVVVKTWRRYEELAFAGEEVLEKLGAIGGEGAFVDFEAVV